MENLTVKAVLTQENGLYFIDFLDLELNETYGESLEEAIEAAQDNISLYIADLEDSGRTFSLSEKEIELKEGQSIVYINVWMPYQRAKIKTVYKKKTLTIPTWLDLLATEKNVNFSSVLVDALKKELGIVK